MSYRLAYGSSKGESRFLGTSLKNLTGSQVRSSVSALGTQRLSMALQWPQALHSRTPVVVLQCGCQLVPSAYCLLSLAPDTLMFCTLLGSNSRKRIFLAHPFSPISIWTELFSLCQTDCRLATSNHVRLQLSLSPPASCQSPPSALTSIPNLW